MGIEKGGSKTAGGYVGGFFHLFDWSAKSRKKLFSTKSDVPERSKQGKRSDGSMPATRLHLMYEDEAGAGSSIRGSDYSCASSVTDDDDGCAARAPGVVARLMGLDSMPTSSEPSSTPFFDTQSLGDVSQRRTNFDYYHDTQIMYSGSLLGKEDGHPRNFAELKPQKVRSSPIEKFQTEILPPRSAKSIPITHHKLLSPIKNPGFVTNKTPAHIMEAAARILEPTPLPSSKNKMPMVGSSSVPLKVRGLKERLEVAQKMPLSGSSAVPLKVRDQKGRVDAENKTSRLAEASSRKPSESNAVKYLKGQSLNKSWNGSVETTPVRAFPESDESSSSLKNKEKSISLAVQAKVNVQRRGGLNSSSNSRALTGQKEHSEVSPSHTFKSQPNTQKTLPKKSILHNTGVLKQNNQKQNSPVDRDRLPSKPSVSTLQSRKVLSGSPLSDRLKTSGKTPGPKVGSRRFGLEMADDDNENRNHSARNNTPMKKRSVDGNFHVQRNQVLDGTSSQSNRKAADSNPAVDRSLNLMEESKKKGMDVVSFTFSAPMTPSMLASETSGSKRLMLDTDSMNLSSAGYNVISGDALSSLLEQKLKELTKSIETSCQKTRRFGLSSSSASMLQDMSPTPEASTLSNAQGKDLSLDKLGRSYDSDLFFTDPVTLRPKHRFQAVDMMGNIGSKLDDSRKVHDYRDPSPISVLEPSFSLESSSSLESAESCCTEGSRACSSVQEPEISGLSSSNKSHYADIDAELSDSASSTSSTSTVTVSRQHKKSLTATHDARSTEWELQYVKKMLCNNLEWMFQDFALGRATEVVNPQLFDRLERHKEGTEGVDCEARLERKVVFDCVSECLDLRCKQFISGGYKTWVKGVAAVRKNERLAEGVCKEIWGWRGMEDCMVDELVDKDMSSQYGRWLDFGVDAFGLGVEIEGRILNSLVDEVVSDFVGF